ncbi:MAG: hypothetical protein AAFY06_07800 [Pseudomonadota bacterium]
MTVPPVLCDFRYLLGVCNPSLLADAHDANGSLDWCQLSRRNLDRGALMDYPTERYAGVV